MLVRATNRADETSKSLVTTQQGGPRCRRRVYGGRLRRIMLPNHAPLRIAEAFHTLEALHPGRIDLSLGRAPGTDQIT
jgi:hypothetical protein